MQPQTLSEILQYWSGLRGSNPAPYQTQIDPAVLGRGLSSLFILEEDRTHRFVFRLAGQRICDLFGCDLAKTKFEDLWLQAEQETIAMLAAESMRDLKPILLQATGHSETGHQASMELVLLPILSPEGECERLLGAIAAMEAASWLGLVPLEWMELDDVGDLLWQDEANINKTDDCIADDMPEVTTGAVAQVARKLMSYF